MINLSDYIKNNIGIAGCGGRMFYPRKPRSCKNCHHKDYDIHALKPRGCSLGFKTKITGEENQQIPLEKCYPVMWEGYGYVTQDHADTVCTKIIEIKKTR